MSLRTALAGPSRLRQPAAPILGPIRARPRPPRTRTTHCRVRCFITIPHPDLKRPGTRHVFVKTVDDIPSLAHAYAISRAVEAYFGETVVSMDLYHSPDTLRPERSMTLQLLRPVEIPKPFSMYTPSPLPTTKELRMWGPSLEDVQSVLSGEASYIVADDTTSRPKDSLAFRVEPMKNPAAPATWPKRENRLSNAARNGIANRQLKKDQQIIAALKRFGGGFHGGFEGIVERFPHLDVPEPVPESDEVEGLPGMAPRQSLPNPDWNFDLSSKPSSTPTSVPTPPSSPIQSLRFRPGSFSLPMKSAEETRKELQEPKDTMPEPIVKTFMSPSSPQAPRDDLGKKREIERQLKLMAIQKETVHWPKRLPAAASTAPPEVQGLESAAQGAIEVGQPESNDSATSAQSEAKGGEPKGENDRSKEKMPEEASKSSWLEGKLGKWF